MEKFEFYKKRAEHRKRLREELPAEQQIKYPAERPGKSIGIPAK